MDASRVAELVADFGDTSYVDEIASATKSFLSLLCGIALDRGLLRDVQGSVYEATGLPLLSSPHNRAITWHHLLQQTSEWDGVLFGKVPTGHRGDRIGESLREPGGYWEYNDVRVNLLGRCLLEVFRRPLSEVLRETVMEQWWLALGRWDLDACTGPGPRRAPVRQPGTLG